MANDNISTKPAAEEVALDEQTCCGRRYRPNVDILERADELVVQADLPGATGDEIDVDFEDGTLRIHAKVPARQEDGTEYLRHEYGVGDYYRTFHVSDAIDTSKTTAEYADGVLTLHLPKAEASKPRKIDVKAAG